jgi:hypothetical protein
MNKDKLMIDKVVKYLEENNIEFENHELIRNINARCLC